MQELLRPDIKKILMALAAHVNAKGIRGLARFLGESENRLYAWIKNGNIAETGVILAKFPNLRREWLKTGEGEMFEDKFRQIAEVASARQRERWRQDSGQAVCTTGVDGLDYEPRGETPEVSQRGHAHPLLTEHDWEILELLKRDPKKYAAVMYLMELNNEELMETTSEMLHKLQKRKEEP